MVGPARESCSMPYARVPALQRPQEPCTGATLRPGQQAAQRSILELRDKRGLTTLLLGLVGAVPTVILAVTLPACRDAAAGVLAAEFIHPAGHLGCRMWARVRRVSSGSQGEGCVPTGVMESQVLQGNVGAGATGNSLQLAGSSLPSTQSLSLSQTQTRGMQRLVIEHWNWLGAQVTSAARGTRE